jgi:hypothetical protein
MSDPDITAYPLARYETYSVKGHGILLKMMLEPFRVDVNHVRIHGTIFLVQDLAVLIRRRR